MTAPHLDDTLASLAAGRIGPDEVRQLRARFFADGAIGLREGEQLFELARRIGEGGSPEWRAFFAEAITDLLVNQVEPRGYLSEANASWLMKMIRADGRLLLDTEFETLLKVIGEARAVPDTLVAFALKTIRDMISESEPRRVSRERVETMRRVLFVASSEGFGYVTRLEAETLFDIAEATAGADNDPSFDDLFARAVGNHVLALAGRTAPSAAEALRRAAWLDESRPLSAGLGAFLQGMLNPFAASDTDPAATPPSEAPVERIDDAEAAWIVERIGRDGTLSRAELALLAFLRSEASLIAPALRPLLDRAA